jgi:hypothetical protein
VTNSAPAITEAKVDDGEPASFSARVSDGGRAEAGATRVLVPENGLPTAADASATVVAGDGVEIDLPARDPDGDRLEYEIVDRPAHGAVALHSDARVPGVTYVAGEHVGLGAAADRFRRAAGRARVAPGHEADRPARGRGCARPGGRRAHQAPVDQASRQPPPLHDPHEYSPPTRLPQRGCSDGRGQPCARSEPREVAMSVGVQPCAVELLH